MPDGLLVTVPVPTLLTERLKGVVTVLNVAVTLLGVAGFTVQVLLVPVQSPLQPAKKFPAAGAAVSVTLLTPGKFTAQVVPQSIPIGLLATVPAPLPALETIKSKEGEDCMLRTKRTASLSLPGNAL